MCYAAQIIAEYRLYVRLNGADIDIDAFVALYWSRLQDRTVKIPKAIDAWFDDPHDARHAEIRRLIGQHHQREAARLEADLFEQRKRLADAERKLQARPNLKGEAEERRIAGNRVRQIMGWLADLRRTEVSEQDRRFYPGWYAPVMVMEHGRRVVKPMRYQCRPAGKPAFFDRKYPGTYNARRDSLEGFWKDLFGLSHAVLIVDRFFENVPLHRAEHRPLAEGETPRSVVLEFWPRNTQPMHVACLWSKWTGPGGQALMSFAAITDDPPPEVAAAGHDRCIVPVKPEQLDAWLSPQRDDLATQHAILRDKQTPHYEHRLAA